MDRMLIYQYIEEAADTYTNNEMDKERSTDI